MNINISAIMQDLVSWTSTHGVTVAIIIIVALLVHFFSYVFLERLIRKIVPADHFHSPEAEKQREDTLIRVVSGVLNVMLWVVASLMVLSETGINIGPLLAAAGIVGIAIGFGGQYLIRDMVAGFFILFENQYRVGDVVCLDKTCGLVEDISIRMATLRDLDGTVHHVPHGTVSKISNKSKEFARVNMNIGVSYSADIEQVIKVVNETGADLFADETWKHEQITPIEFQRVDDFADSAVIIKVLGETKPLKQWAVAGEFRKRIKIAFDKAKIEIPFPQRVIHQSK
ncbi:mechanosensitive ion channel family protein [Patescibacteria group bacterium]|nr:MAG: mechanosensitive ion channel family protein [Patescibacteria group bacterium]